MGKKNLLFFAKKKLRKNQDITLMIVLTGLITGIITKEMMRSKIRETHEHLEEEYDNCDSINSCSNCKNSNCSRNSKCRGRRNTYGTDSRTILNHMKHMDKY
jgi:hypothetical protein